MSRRSPIELQVHLPIHPLHRLRTTKTASLSMHRKVRLQTFPPLWLLRSLQEALSVGQEICPENLLPEQSLSRLLLRQLLLPNKAQRKHLLPSTEQHTLYPGTHSLPNRISKIKTSSTRSRQHLKMRQWPHRHSRNTVPLCTQSLSCTPQIRLLLWRRQKQEQVQHSQIPAQRETNLPQMLPQPVLPALPPASQEHPRPPSVGVTPNRKRRPFALRIAVSLQAAHKPNCPLPNRSRLPPGSLKCVQPTGNAILSRHKLSPHPLERILGHSPIPQHLLKCLHKANLGMSVPQTDSLLPAQHLQVLPSLELHLWCRPEQIPLCIPRSPAM